MAEKFTYVHVGAQPITYMGTWYVKGDEFVADPEGVAFFMAIGAVEKKAAAGGAPTVVPFHTMQDGPKGAKK